MAGAPCSIDESGMSAWCSATFLGARHSVVLRVSGADSASRAESLAGRLPDAEFSFPHHIVVDTSVEHTHVTADSDVLLTIGALTIEDW